MDEDRELAVRDWLPRTAALRSRRAARAAGPRPTGPGEPATHG